LAAAIAAIRSSSVSAGAGAAAEVPAPELPALASLAAFLADLLRGRVGGG